LLEYAAGRGVAIEICTHACELTFVHSGGQISEFKTNLDFVEVSIAIVGKPLPDKITVRLLGVVKYGFATRSIHVNKNRTMIKIRDAKLIGKPMAMNFRLGRALASAVAGAEKIDVRFSEQCFIRGE
jgi:hypothetical protein